MYGIFALIETYRSTFNFVISYMYFSDKAFPRYGLISTSLNWKVF